MTTRVLEATDATETRQCDDEGAFDDLSSRFSQEPDRSFCRATRRDEIVDQQNACAPVDCVDLYLYPILSVLELEFSPDPFSRELAWLAERNEADAQRDGDRCPEYESPCLDSSDDVDAAATMTRRDAVDGCSQTVSIA